MGCDVKNNLQVNTAGSCGGHRSPRWVVSPMFRLQQGRGVDSGAVTVCMLLNLPTAACGLRQTAQSIGYHMVVITYICVN
jgi:hypothetical protein